MKQSKESTKAAVAAFSKWRPLFFSKGTLKLIKFVFIR